MKIRIVINGEIADFYIDRETQLYQLIEMVRKRQPSEAPPFLQYRYEGVPWNLDDVTKPLDKLCSGAEVVKLFVSTDVPSNLHCNLSPGIVHEHLQQAAQAATGPPVEDVLLAYLNKQGMINFCAPQGLDNSVKEHRYFSELKAGKYDYSHSEFSQLVGRYLKAANRLLHKAVQNNDVMLSKCALWYLGADVNNVLSNPPSYTPALIVASSQGNTELVKILLRSGADVNSIDQLTGNSALISAAVGNHIEITEELLNINGINTTHVNYVSGSALFVARDRGFTELVKLLEQHQQSSRVGQGGATASVSSSCGSGSFLAASLGAFVTSVSSSTSSSSSSPSSPSSSSLPNPRGLTLSVLQKIMK